MIAVEIASTAVAATSTAVAAQSNLLLSGHASTMRYGRSMGMKRRPGRPTIDDADRRDVMFFFRLTSAERAVFEKAANRAGLSIAAWLRQLAHEAIQRQEGKR